MNIERKRKILQSDQQGKMFKHDTVCHGQFACSVNEQMQEEVNSLENVAKTRQFLFLFFSSSSLS